MKKSLIALFACLLMLSGCYYEQEQGNIPEAELRTTEIQDNLPDESPDTDQEEETEGSAAAEDNDSDSAALYGSSFFDMFNEPAVMLQFQPITPGEELVVIHTNHGDITLRLFPEEAPLSVENFLTHARNGYYDGVIFHRVLQDFMIQGGDPTGTGGGGQSIWGDPFFVKWMIFQFFDEQLPDDIRYELPSINLKHFRGALAMAHAGGQMGSQFYIVQNQHSHPAAIANNIQNITYALAQFSEVPEGFIQTMDEVLELYIIHGGTPHLDWWWTFESSHIVFGHVVEGMDIVDSIAGVDVDGAGRPFESVYIERISFFIFE